MAPMQPSKLEKFGSAIDPRNGKMLRGAGRGTYSKKTNRLKIKLTIDICKNLIKTAHKAYD